MQKLDIIDPIISKKVLFLHLVIIIFVLNRRLNLIVLIVIVVFLRFALEHRVDRFILIMMRRNNRLVSVM